MIFPALPEGAHAEEPATATPRVIEDPTVSLSVPVTIEFADVMATPDGATTTASAEIEVTTTASAGTTTASAEIEVTTTASAGYKLYVYAEDNSLKSLNPQTTQAITATTQVASEVGALENNTWCYNLFNSYSFGTGCTALPTTNTTPIQTKDTSTTNSANDTYILYLGAKVDSTIPSGTYTSTLTISVVAEPRKLTLSGISNMQDMTSEICAASSENETKRLIDARDGKIYWVAKLADNQCWMTQNLDLDLDSSKPLTTADSDISDLRGSWTPTDTQKGAVGFDGNDSYSSARSFDPGAYANNAPTAWTSCNNYWSGGSCSNWTNVSNMSPMTEIRDESTGIVDANNNTYDAHYLAGNYYQWNAATAGTGEYAISANVDATDSICPKGWKLPTSSSSGLGSFHLVTNMYGITTSTIDNVTKSPLYFIPAGYVAAGSLNDAGSFGYYWSTTAGNSYYAYYFVFGASTYNQSSGGYRYRGQPVRCLAR